MTDAALYTELTTDPASLGYASHVSSRDDGGLAALINSSTGTGSGTVTVASVSKHDMLGGLIPATMRLSGMSVELQAKWTKVLDMVCAADYVTIAAETLGLFAAAVADGVVYQAEVDALTTRAGSRAEVLWGVGTGVTVDQVSRVLNTQGA